MKNKYALVLLVMVSFALSAWAIDIPIFKPHLTESTNFGVFENLLSGKCMDPEGSSTSNGTRVLLNDCDGSSDQKWELTSDNFIWNPHSGKCLDVSGNPGTENEKSLQLWDCETSNSGTDQKWALTSDGYLQNLLSGRCVDVPSAQGTTSGSALQLWTCEFNASSTDQRWSFIEETSVSVEENDSSALFNDDDDKDGLDNQLEFGIMNKYMPKYIYDEEEHNILLDQDPEDFGQGQGVVYLYQVSPVDCSLDYAGDETVAIYEPYVNLTDSSSPPTLLLTILSLYPYDYLPYNTLFTSEDDVFAHHGDVERLRICLLESATSPWYDFYFLHVRRHGHDAIYGPNELTWEFYNTYDHPVLYVSEGKHATYKSKDECEDAVSGFEWLAWEEHCDGGKEIWPIAYDSAKNLYYNVGEYEPFKSFTLDDIGYSDQFKQTAASIGLNYFPEYIWTPFYDDPSNRQAHFCGGMDKKDFFGAHDVITPGYSAENCPGGISGELWISENKSNSSSCLEFDYDRKGGDYRSFELTSPDPYVCMASCVDDEQCASFSYVQPGMLSSNAMCFLKNMESFPSNATGIISGLRRNCSFSDLPDTSISLPSFCLQYDTDYWGSDYKSFYSTGTDPSDCLSTCMSDSKCLAWTYVPPGVQGTDAICYLKDSVPTARSAEGMISGLRSDCQ